MQIITPSFLTEQATRLVSLADALAGQQPPRRCVVGIAGIPAAGKSTLVAQLYSAVDDQSPDRCVVVPMDGFHYPNAELEARGLRHVKGAPETFDVERYVALLAQLRDARAEAAFPVYDRRLHEPAWRDVPQQRVSHDVRLILTEGNYLLLDEAPWNRLAGALDECWFLDTPGDVAQRWLLDRHVRGGRERSDAEAHIRRSDARNALRIRQSQRPADLVVRWP